MTEISFEATFEYSPEEQEKIHSRIEEKLSLQGLNGKSQEDYLTSVFINMDVEELKRRIKVDEEFIAVADSIIYWIMVGRGPKSGEILQKYKERNAELNTKKKIKELVLQKKLALGGR